MNLLPIPLDNKIVLITGASSGFGADAAQLFAAEGCKVVLAARRIDRLQALAEKIRGEGGEALAVPVDVANHNDIENMVRSALDLYGQVDILFNNAGFGRMDWLDKLDPERDIETQVQVNLTGLIQVARAVLPHMLERREGHIINMSSVAGRIAPPFYSVYSATKFGVRGFTEALRREVSPFGVRVTGVYPAYANTEFSLRTGRSQSRRKPTPLDSLRMSSEYVARRVVGLAKHPRRSLVIPWWYNLAIGLNDLTPALMDVVMNRLFTHRYHK